MVLCLLSFNYQHINSWTSYQNAATPTLPTLPPPPKSSDHMKFYSDSFQLCHAGFLWFWMHSKEQHRLRGASNDREMGSKEFSFWWARGKIHTKKSFNIFIYTIVIILKIFYFLQAKIMSQIINLPWLILVNNLNWSHSSIPKSSDYLHYLILINSSDFYIVICTRCCGRYRENYNPMPTLMKAGTRHTSS